MKIMLSILVSFMLSPFVQAAEPSPFIKDELVNNSVLTEYYSEYEKLADEFTLSDLEDLENFDGSTVEEVLEGFETSVEPQVMDLNEQVKLIEWRYEGEEISASTQQPSIAQLVAYFQDDHLLFIGFATLDHSAEPGKAISRAVFDEWMEEPEIKAEDIAKAIQTEQKNVLGVSQIKIQGELIRSVLVFVNAEEEDQELENSSLIYVAPIIYGDHGFYHTSLRTYEELLQSPMQLMLDDSFYLVSLVHQEVQEQQ